MSKKMFVKTGVALLLVAIVLPPFIYGKWLLKVLLGAISFLVAIEIASLADKKFHPLMILLISAFLFSCFLTPEKYYISIVSAWFVLLFAIQLFTDKIPVDAIAYDFLLTFIGGIALKTVNLIYTFDQPYYIMIYLCLTAFITDTCAYFAGSFLGKHKMIERVSPHKTWEGALGGYLGGALVSALFAIFTIKNLPQGCLIAGALILPAVSQIGDLSFSLIKRHFHLKDFSSVFPGHGGMLDRIDSLLFCLSVFRILLVIWGII